MYQNQPGMTPFVPDEPFFQAIASSPKDRNGRLVIKRSMGGFVAVSVLWCLLLIAMLVLNIVMSGMFGILDAVFITMGLASVVIAVVGYFKQRRKIVMDGESILFVTGSRKSTVSYREVTAVSALAPFRMQAQNAPVFEELSEPQQTNRAPAVVSLALYLRDASGGEYTFPIVGKGFADRFELLTSKLDGMGFEGEFEKIRTLYLSHRVDLRTRTILPQNAHWQPQDPFQL